MSQEKTAHQAGSIRQSANAALRGFERRGWIELHDRAIAARQERPWPDSTALTCRQADSFPVGQLTPTRVVI